MYWLETHRWINAWLASLQWSKIAATGLPIVISFAALCIVIYDRRPHLALKARKGEWYTLTPTMGTSGDVIFRGIVEIYNRSNRANAIRGYHFRSKADGTWKDMESELYRNTYRTLTAADDEKYNETPLSLAPYSGVEAHVQGITVIPNLPRRHELQVKIEVEDLFGKKYCVEVKAVGP